MKATERPKYKAPPPPRDFNPRQSFSTRQLPGGSPVFDKVFPTAIGFAIGSAISFFLILGNPERMRFSFGGIDHPLFTGAIAGFCVGTLLSPLVLYLTRKTKSNRGILPWSFGGGLLAGCIMNMIG
ncbi:MAG: hypothetical protein O3A95_06460 [Planctomycetota bacterium]|nr:hypothetical protein [Planctomycetota bacterium]MDA1113924.1 hypothetical protein [Planctomycetota bacterium]